jgi:4-hydroxy-3-methylbut-2-enyl diphosphate reductase
MKIEVESRSGFCFGVENAISIAEESLISGETVYCLGSIVHNEQEVTRLQKLGLRTIDHDQMKGISNCKLLIRAHGEPPSTYEIARENSIEIIEATCPIVRKLQTRIKNAWKLSIESGAQIVIFGREGHAEVVGLLGQADNSILLRSEDDIKKLDFNRPVVIFSQTTRSREKYDEITRKISTIYEEKGMNSTEMVKVNKTICGQVANREPSLIEFSKRHDTMIFVSGKESSNGKMLYEVCKSVNKNSYFISSPDEIDPKWFGRTETVGISGATSTPKWLINEVSIKINQIGESMKLNQI